MDATTISEGWNVRVKTASSMTEASRLFSARLCYQENVDFPPQHNRESNLSEKAGLARLWNQITKLREGMKLRMNASLQSAW